MGDAQPLAILASTDLSLLCSIAVGNVAASSNVRNITIPEDCSSTPQPSSGNLTLRGNNNYFLLPGLQFGNLSCQPSITSIALSGEGNFSIGLLQMEKRPTNNSHDYQIKRQLYLAQRENLFNITPPFQLDVYSNVIIGFAVYCKPPRGGVCVFRETSQKSARYSDKLWTSTETNKSSTVTFPQGESSTHPVFSLSLSCK